MFLANKKMEEAIRFLVHSEPVCPSGKPVILHSLRVAFYLMNDGYGTKVVIATVLHDVLEDTATSLENIKKKFGKGVAELVLACSFDKSVSNETRRYEESFQRAAKYGTEALVIKAADILDNSYYIKLADYSKQKWLLEKIRHFLDISKNQIGRTKVYKDSTSMNGNAWRSRKQYYRNCSAF